MISTCICLLSTLTVQLEAPKVEGGVVLTVGMGDIGQLGLGPDVEERTRPGVVNLPEDIVAIAAGGLHTVCLDKNGKVRACVLSLACNPLLHYALFFIIYLFIFHSNQLRAETKQKSSLSTAPIKDNRRRVVRRVGQF